MKGVDVRGLSSQLDQVIDPGSGDSFVIRPPAPKIWPTRLPALAPHSEIALEQIDPLAIQGHRPLLTPLAVDCQHNFVRSDQYVPGTQGADLTGPKATNAKAYQHRSITPPLGRSTIWGIK